MATKKIFTVLDLQNNNITGVGAPSADTDVATKASAQAQANAAQSAAISAAEADATSKANAAQAAAIAAAQSDATSKANAAQAAAIAAAEADATSKANAAQAAAIAAAQSDATSKANAAQAAAIAAAQSDATSKANTAETNAKTYADGLITNLVNGAGPALDTLNELAAALGNDPNFATTISTSLGTKLSLASVNITGDGTVGADGVEYTVAHNLNKANVIVQAYEGNDSVDVFVRKVNNNSLKIITGAALGSTTLTVLVAG
jgi:hypothetical protein